jgi:hypothetical protein
MGFFELETSGAMLQKAKRELKRLEADVSVDNVFNFFVTAYHVADYLDESLKTSALADGLIVLCGDACNKAKHMKLTRKRKDPKTPKHYHVTLQAAAYAKVAIDADGIGSATPGEASIEPEILPAQLDRVDWCIAWPDGSSLEVVSFAQAVIAKWEEFFAAHGISE